MAYSAWSVVFGEQPSAAKWNILGTNDSYFNDIIGASAGGALFDVNIYTADDTWSKPTGLKFVEVEVQAGGGGGGGSGTAVDQVGSGGAGGGYSYKKIAAASLSANETVTVGIAGTAGTSSGDGGAGGNSSFGTHATTTGGGGGLDGNTGGSIDGGTPGTGSSGDINITAQYGSPGGTIASIGGAYLRNGFGGSSKLGIGARRDSQASNQPGNAGIGYGAGGSGGARIGASNVAGGAGTAGIVIVREYF